MTGSTADLAQAFNDILPNDIDLAPFVECGRHYEMQLASTRQSNAFARAELTRLEAQAMDLAETLSSLSIGVVEALTVAAIQHGELTIAERVASARSLAGWAAVALRTMPEPVKGRAASPNGFLVRRLKAALDQAGLPADASRTGNLVRLFAATAKCAGQAVVRPDVVVRHELGSVLKKGNSEAIL